MDGKNNQMSDTLFDTTDSRTNDLGINTFGEGWRSWKYAKSTLYLEYFYVLSL